MTHSGIGGFAGGFTTPNTGNGVHLINAPNNTIDDNSIAGNGANGVHLSGAGSTGNVVTSNNIGISFTGPIGAHGVLVDNGTSNRIGGFDGDGNDFVNVALNGVRVTGTARLTSVVGNTFALSVAGLPIDLGGDGVTPNDLGTPPDTDNGPNDLQNFPTLKAVSLSGNSYVIGELRSTPGSTFRVELFSSGSNGGGSDGSFNGALSVTTDVNGLATFTQSFGRGIFSDGLVVYATATSLNGTGNTSEASPATFATGTEFVQLIGLRTAKFIDSDGDPVTVTATSGVFDLDIFALVPTGKGARLETLTLDPSFNRASLAITAGKGKGGDGFVNVGTITADNTNLDALTIDGDLSYLSVGRENVTQSLEKLTVRSLGMAGGIDFPGIFTAGGIGSISVLADVEDFDINLQGGLFRDFIVKGSIDHLDFSAHSLGSPNVKGDMLNSSITTQSGAIGNITVGGSILDTESGSGIHAATTIGAIDVKKDIASTGTGRLSITAGGILNPPAADTSPTIRSLKTGGNVINTDLLAGYTADFDPVNHSVRLGALTIGGNWMGSNAVAGALRGPDGFFGTGDDLPIAVGTPGNIARIASVLIKGTVTGSGTDKFGFVADQIGSFKFGKTVLALTAGKDDFAVGTATTVHVHVL